VKQPRVRHVSSCTFEHAEKERHRCRNMARSPEIVPVFVYCPDCSNPPVKQNHKEGELKAVKTVEEVTAVKATTGNPKTEEVLKARAGPEEADPEDWKVAKEHLVIGDEAIYEDSPTNAESKADAKVKQQSSPGASKEILRSDVEKISDSLEETAIGEGWVDLGRLSSAASWVEVESGTEWNLGDEDQGLLTQRQMARKPQRMRWLLGLLAVK
jgi:hypothetical protein